jgi:hypothetical protein
VAEASLGKPCNEDTTEVPRPVGGFSGAFFAIKSRAGHRDFSAASVGDLSRAMVRSGLGFAWGSVLAKSRLPVISRSLWNQVSGSETESMAAIT